MYTNTNTSTKRKTVTGMKVIIDETNKESYENEIRYRGGTKTAGIRSGQGLYKYPHGGNGLFQFRGEYQDGIKHELDQGNGTFTVKGLLQYTGQFDGGEITGKGAKTFVNGSRYEGQFRYGEMHGEGTWESSDGDEVYVGQFVDNKRHGEGVLTWRKNGSVFRGQFAVHKRNGHGTYLLKNHLFLEADFSMNTMHGHASVQWHRRATYHGLFDSGRMGGEGRFEALDGSYLYHGSFHRGHPMADAEAAYLHTQLDRTMMGAPRVSPGDAVADKKNAPGGGKSGPGAKGQGLEPPVERIVVAAGGGVGRLVVRAGPQRLLDDEILRVELALAELAANASATAAKSGKGKPLPAGAPAALPPEPANPCPDPPVLHPTPCEVHQHHKLIPVDS